LEKSYVPYRQKNPYHPQGRHRQGGRRRDRGEGTERSAAPGASGRHQLRARRRHLTAKTASEDPQLRKLHGLSRSLIANAVTGVTDGFKRELDIVGVGYRAELKGKQVIFALGYSHAVVFDIPHGIDVAIDKQTHITVTGVDRQLVGQVAANIRRLREPDPYKQKGVRYTAKC
jgi:ribosomal protein L6P/L9E